MLLEQLDAAVVADRVGDPRADEVGDRADGDGREQACTRRRETLKPGEQHRRLATGSGCRRSRATISRKTPGRPRSPTTFVANVDELVGDRGEDEERREQERSEATGYRSAPWPSRCSTRHAAGSRSRRARAPRVERVLDAGRFILGPEVEAFEAEFAAYVGARHAIGVANGTEALTIALRALGVGPGRRGRRARRSPSTPAPRRSRRPARGPVFCDVDPETFCVTPETVQRRADAAHEGRHRRAPVRQRRAGRARSRRSGVPVARGRRAGGRLDGRRRRGRARSARSRRSRFYPSKNLGALRRRRRDRDRRRRASPTACAMLRFHGSRDKVTYERGGLQLAPRRAAGRRSCACSCPHLDGWADAPPRRPPRWYAEAGLGELVGAARSRRRAPTPAWHLYVVRSERADELAGARCRRPASARAPTTACRSTASPRWRRRAAGELDLPGTEEAARTHLALPISAALTREQVDEVVDAVRRCASGST